MTDERAAALRWMADHIERVGLHQGGRLYAPHDPARKSIYEIPCCVLGAALLIPSDPSCGYAVPHMDFLRQRVGSISYWSDKTPQDEVLATLRRVADELESLSA